jgi:histone deacetylase 8
MFHFVSQGGEPLSLDADIPEYSGYLHFKPSFTLDVPAGNMRDQNTEEHLQTIEATYENILPILHSRMVS